MEEQVPYEHLLSLQVFAFLFLLSGFGGVFVGGLVDKFIQKLQNTKDGIENSKLNCFGFLSLQLFIVAILLYIAIKLHSRKFDYWVWSTYSGCLAFGLFFSVQDSISNNASCLLHF